MKKILLVPSLLIIITVYAFLLTACSNQTTTIDLSFTEAENVSFQIEPCTVKWNSGEFAADCGTLIVPENLANSKSRMISLPITRIRATGSNPAAPIFHLTGGAR